jgi:hypothetical protein
MCCRFQIIALLFLPAGLFSQKIPSDTPDLRDTIPAEASMLKRSPGFTVETVVDSVNTLVINELLASNSGSLPDNFGDDDDWFEVYNYGDEPVSLDQVYFTDDPADPFKWKMDTLFELDPGKHQLIWADGEPEEGYHHASFRLSAQGEYLAIFAGDGSPVDQRYFGEQTTNVSYGRYPDAGLTWNYFSDPTPGAANENPGTETILPAPTSNLSGGFYTSPVFLALFANVPGARIFYTTDCTVPDSTDLLYRSPVEISSSTIVRARLIKEGAMDSPVFTISILMDDFDYEHPVVSLVAEPEALFGNAGIISASNSTLEASAHMEYMEEGNALFKGGAGLQLHAPSHSKPYSLKLFARNRYGNDWFEYPFFNDQAPERFRRLILRNSGNDNVNNAETNIHFRDPLIHTLGRRSNRKALTSASQPVNVYLNGSYHGLFNLREREDRYYLETHSGVTEDFDFIELEFGYYGNIHVIEGSYDSWRELLCFVDTTGDLSLDTDYMEVKEMVDLENFTDYWITEVFVGNYDWLSNNVKFWKPHNGKWQWLYWDTDHGLGLVYSNFGKVEWNTLNWSLTFSDRAWSNGYNNILIRNLLKNEGYKEHFIKRFTQLLSTSFSYEFTRSLLDSMKSRYAHDMEIHTEHWNRSMSDWYNATELVDDYLKRRPDTVLNHIRDFFGLQDPVHVSIKVEPPGAGTISFSGLDISTKPLEGKFFPGMDYELTTASIPGFSFDRWKPFESQDDAFVFPLEDSLDVVAYFIPSDQSFPVQLCEVYANNRSAYDPGDWMEFYYYGADSLPMGGWYITGDQDQLLYTFTEDVVLPPGQRFVVCEDKESFKEIFPLRMYCYGDLRQDVSTNSTLSLRSPDGEIKKTVSLLGSTDWPVLPPEGYSLELRHITDDTESGSNWEISEDIFGSPGLSNHLCYQFRAPSGKDSVFSNHETHVLEFTSSEEYYLDHDHHKMAGISILELSGPGLLHSGSTEVEEGKLYGPSDLVFSPREPYTVASKLTYSFTDISGQESPAHMIQFMSMVHTPPEPRAEFHLYPVPAKDYCIIDLPSGHQGPVDFDLFDLNGRKLQSIHVPDAGNQFHIDLSRIENGVYFYLIRTRQAAVNGKIEVIK